MKRITIAIDGFSSCGKSTMAKDLAKTIGYIYIDSGAMYRAVTFYALENGLISGDGHINEARLESDVKEGKVRISFILDEKTQSPQTCLNGKIVEKEIRQMRVSERVSPIAALPFVREALTLQQQEMGKEKGIVMDGRDIGTTVFPDAELKIFVKASAEIRAKRRYDELIAKGEKDVRMDDIIKNVKERDDIDQHRAVSPLRQADDALVLDNSHMTIEEQKQWLINKFEERTENK
ncbi:MAG: (d)CMP kinase [Bacteroides sp.]|nr:(d)CMP kinase [Roseburia sp.]MCM1346649.1 (d)CMP kinase [Bacteroides sp.]MCM1419921.1 (d)CMP kinase [Bacteroides sp.]